MLSFRKITNLILLCLFIISCVSTQTIPASGRLHVEARQWSKVNGLVHYSEWKTFNAVAMSDLKGFTRAPQTAQTKFGSDSEHKFQATGFFYVTRAKDRWWIIDPQGYASVNVGMNGVRPGTSIRNKETLRKKFESEENWITRTHKDLEAFGFNGTACWSEAPLVKFSNQHCLMPLSNTMILSLFSGYQKQQKKEKNLKNSFPVFDEAFESFVDKQAQKLSETKDDPTILGYFSDNELSFNTSILDEYLSITDTSNPNYIVAKKWIENQGIAPQDVNSKHREMFLGVVAGRYYKIVANAIKKYDPNHMYLGSRLHGKPEHNEYIVAAAGRYCDIISINYYGQWEPAVKHFDEWCKWADRPVIITEFYIKGDDAGLPNFSGAGWRVRTQEERGIFYENFCLKLLQMKNCVGWHWFKYMDNDPTDTASDESNNDSNKGIVNNDYEYYMPLTNHMKEVNLNRYDLIRYFDAEPRRTKQ